MRRFFYKGVIILKDTKLRVVWNIPNVFCYLIIVGLSIFIVLNVEGLREVNRLGIWVISIIILFLISIYGSYRIWSWIKEGKM
jgi:hypothetical protein